MKNSKSKALSTKSRLKVEDLPQCENSRFNGTRKAGQIQIYKSKYSKLYIEFWSLGFWYCLGFRFSIF